MNNFSNMPRVSATPNFSKLTFTIRQTWSNGDKTKYRTYKMTKAEFNSCLHNTENDWRNHLKTAGDYYQVK